MEKFVSKENLKYFYSKLSPKIQEVKTDVEDIKEQLTADEAGKILYSTEDGTEWKTLNIENGEGQDSIKQKYTDGDEEYNNVVTGKGSAAFGYNNNVSSNYSFASGLYNYVNGYSSHAEGNNNKINTGSNQHAEGNNNKINGSNSWANHVEGDNNSLNNGGYGCHIEGQNNIGNPYSSDPIHVEGKYCTGGGSYTHTEGYGCSTNDSQANSSHAEGFYTTSTRSASHAEGYYTKATNTAAHAEGYYTQANSWCSHAEGYYTITSNDSEHAQGNYNKSNRVDDIYTIHSIGVGSSEDDRKNAQEVMQNGDFYVIGIGNYDGTNPYEAQTLQKVINSKATLTPGEVGQFLMTGENGFEWVTLEFATEADIDEIFND